MPATNEQPGEWLSVPQAAKRLGVNPQTIHNLLEAGKIGGVFRDGRIVRIKASSFEKYIKSHSYGA